MKEKLNIIIATVFYTGLSPVAPGTVGTIAGGIPLYYLFSLLPPVQYLCAIYVFFWFSCYFAHHAEKTLNEKDSSKIVIDEVIGYLVAMAFVPTNLKTVAAGFLLFRFFDIQKTYPSNLIEKSVPGGLGICLDDVVAGLYANVVLQFILFAAPNLLR